MTEKNNHKKTEVKTTGHKWDEIEELDNPVPSWQLTVFLVCFIWAICYWVAYPSWPTIKDHLKGVLGWTKDTEIAKSRIELDKIQNNYIAKIKKHSLEEIISDKDLTEFAIKGGRSAFKENCSACHGMGAQGGIGYPNLNDDDWLWGGKLSDIYYTLKNGIRANHQKTRQSQMPSFGRDELLTKEEIEKLAEYVMTLSSNEKSQDKIAQKLFVENCASCHGKNGKGLREFGAPNLTDKIWLYGGDKKSIINTIYYAKQGVMPYWSDRLNDETIKQLTIYVYSLGGGEK